MTSALAIRRCSCAQVLLATSVLTMTWSAPVTAAGAPGSIVLTSTGFEIGSTAVVTLQGDASTTFRLLFDTVPGDFTLPGGAWLGLGLSPAFQIVTRSQLGADGRATVPLPIPDDPNLVGLSLYLQALQIDQTTDLPDTSNRLDGVFEDGSGAATVSATIPAAGTAVSAAASFELWVDARLRDSTVNANTVRLHDGSGGVLNASVSLQEGAGGAVVRVEPATALPRGDTVQVRVSGGLQDEAGNPLTGPLTFSFPVRERQHPVLINNPTELNLFRTRINQGQSPWKPAWDYLKKEVDKYAMPASPKPHSGKPPTSDPAFRAMYNDWFTDARYALDCAIAWHVTGQTSYASKARTFLTAWFVFDPAVVGQWYWSIQYDIAGINYALAADYLWDYSGLTATDRVKIRALLDDVAAVVQQYQQDTSDRNPGNIRSWNNALIATVGYFNEREDLVQWVLDPNLGNPFDHWTLFDEAMAADGEMYDTVRGNSTPYQGITYPAYHLHAWSVLSEVALHHGLDLYSARNRHGVTQKKGWQWLYPYMNGTKSVSGLTSQVIEDFCIAKMYMIQRVVRDGSFENLFNRYTGEPLYESHITKKAASFTHNMPSSLVGTDGAGPNRVVALATESIGATTVHLTWREGAVGDEGDLAYRYDVYRGGQWLGSTGATEFVDLAAPAGASHSYKVVAYDFTGNASPGAFLTVQTLPLP